MTDKPIHGSFFQISRLCESALFAVCILNAQLHLPAQSQTESRESTLAAGMAAYKSGDYQKAAQLLSDETHPELGENARALYYRADALTKIGRIPRALTSYRKARALNQDAQINAYCDQAIITLSKGSGTGTSSLKTSAQESMEEDPETGGTKDRPEPNTKPILARATDADRARIKFFHKSPDMQPLYDNVLAAITLMPPGVKSTFKQANVYWIIMPTLVEFDPKFGQTMTPGREGQSYAYIGGTFSKKENAVLMAVRALQKPDDQLHILDQRLHTALHESGHGFDSTLGQFSNSEVYLRAFNEDVSAMSQEKKDRYKTDLNGGAHRRKETFAELFAMKISADNKIPTPPGKSRLVEDFPHCRILVEGLIK